MLDALQTKMRTKYWGGDGSVPGPLLIDIMILGYRIHWALKAETPFGPSMFKNYKYRRSITDRWPMPGFLILKDSKPETFIDAHTGLEPGEYWWVKKINWIPVVHEIKRIEDGGSRGIFLAAQEIWERWSFDYEYIWPGRDRVYKDDLEELLKSEPGWD